MAKFSHTDSRRMYSWWWDSHISPKNSKWLQENLTDMDAKVKVMIKLIEEDADSFAKRAEMYYKKRPELMRMVEESYRAYRALAERYDHATGVIRHAHTTMAEAFPNQVNPMFGDDSPISSDSPITPDISTPTRKLHGDDDSYAAKSNVKLLNEPFRSADRVRKGLNFDETDEKSSKSDGSAEILTLKEALAKLETEKEMGQVQYQQSLDKLSELESEISKTREEFRVLTDHANEADKELVILKESLAKLETEKESNLQDYERCLTKMSDLEKMNSTSQEYIEKSKMEALSVKGELDKVVLEKDAALDQYVKSLDMISKLENKVRLTEEDAAQFKERAEKAEIEVETLKETIFKLKSEISSLEQRLRTVQDEADNRASKLKGVEEKCVMLERSNLSLHSELESLMLKMGTQNEELDEKQKELGKLWGSIQDERLRFVEAETAFQTLQHLHAQTQEELQSMASELQKRARLLSVVETHNQSLQEEVVNIKEEKKHLDELNKTSALSMKDMQNEIAILEGSYRKLEEEVELRLDQRNALQQEIYCLKEEMNDLNKNHLSVLDQVNQLQDENSNLQESLYTERSEKESLLEKLEVLEQLLEKNTILENSLSDVNAELEAVRGKIEALEQSLQSLLKEKMTLLDEKSALQGEKSALFDEKCALLDEKSALMTRLEETNKNLESVKEGNTVLVSTLSDAHSQLEALTTKVKVLEDSCQLLVNEKFGLINEKEGLTGQLENTRTRLEELGKIYGELEGRYAALEKVKEEAVGEFEAESRSRKRELDEVLDNCVAYEIEIFVLSRTARELERNNRLFLMKNRELMEQSILSERNIVGLEKKKLDQEIEIKSLSDQVQASVGKSKHDQVYISQLSSKIEDTQKSLYKAEEGNQQSILESSILITWIRQLTLEAQCEVLKLLEKNEELRSNLREGDIGKMALTTQFENLQGNFRVLKRENTEIRDEKRVLTDNIVRMEEKYRVLEDENCALCDEIFALGNLSLIFRNCAEEKFKVERELRGINGVLMGKLSLAEGCLEESRAEILDQKEKLQMSRGEIENKNAMLHQIEKEILELRKIVEDLRIEGDKAKMIRADQENQIGKLSTANDQLSMENNCLQEKSKMLEVELHESRVEGGNLKSDLKKKIDEIDELERLAESIFDQLQFSMVNRVIYEKKSHELHESCLGYIDQNERLRTQLDAYRPEIVSMKKYIASLENHTDLPVKIQNREIEELQGAEIANDPHRINLNEDNNSLIPDTFSELKYLQARLQALGKATSDKNQLMVQEISKLSDINGVLMGKLSLAERCLEESRIQNTEFSTFNEHLSTENNRLQEANNILKVELNESRGEGVNLKSDLKKKIDEIDELDCWAESILGQLQCFMVNKVIYEQKLYELNEACLGYIDQNEGLKIQLNAYGPEIVSMKECIASLENQTELPIKIQNPEIKELQAAQIANDPHESNLKKDENALIPGTFFELQNLQARVKAIEKATCDKSQLTVLEISKLHDINGVLTAKLSLAEGRLEESKSEITEISTVNDHLSTENDRLQEANKILEVDLHESRGEGVDLKSDLEKKMAEIEELHVAGVNLKSDLKKRIDEIEELHVEGGNLKSDMRKKIDEIDELEIQAASVFGELQYSIVNQVIYEQKLHELHEACVGYIEQNEGLKNQLDAYGPEIESMKECIASLENHLDLPIKIQDPENKELQGAQIANDPENASIPDTFSKLRNLQARLRAIEKATLGKNQLVIQENTDLRSKLESSTYQIEMLKSKIGHYNRNLNKKSEISEEDDSLLTKDIMLDQISDSSQSKKKVISQPTEFHRVKSAKKQRSESLDYIEKEMSIDKLENSDNSKRFSDPVQGVNNKKKILERLDSDVQKLANLQITVQDLKRKLEVTEKHQRGKSVLECEAIKGQLEETDLGIMKLFDFNGKLMKSVENSTFSDMKSSFDLEGDEGSRKKVSDQARRMSEKIGRLQLEVQKLQFVLLKLGGEKEGGKSKVVDTRKRTLLRDYLYGVRTGKRGTKSRFCGCIEPKTVED